MQDRKRYIFRTGYPLIILLLIHFFCIPAPAQKIPFENYTIQNGLPQSSVYDIDQDHKGYIWFATQVGAARFDGYEFQYFNTSNGLPDDFVNCFLVDRSGRVWMGTEDGVAIYEDGEIRILSTEDGLVDRRVDRLTEDASGNIWMGTAYGLSVYTGDTLISYVKDRGLAGGSVMKLMADSRGRVHVATNPPAVTVFEDPYTSRIILEGELIRDIMETSEGEIWYASQQTGGIHVLSGDELRTLGIEQGLTCEVTLSLMEDQEGRIWCGTYPDGLFIYEDGRFTRRFSGYQQEPIARSMIQDRHHRIWVQSFDNGVWLVDRGEFHHYSISNELVHDGVEDLFEDRYGNIWIATLNGVSKYGKVIFEIYDMEVGLPDDHVISVFADSKERIWIGTQKNLLYLNDHHLQQIGERMGYQEGHTTLSFAEDDRGRIYIGRDSGLFRFDGERLVEVDMGLHKYFSKVNSLLYTPGGALWCATDSGVYIRETDREVTILGPDQGLVYQQVNDLELLGDMVCCATEAGLSIFSLEGEHLVSYREQDGLISGVCIDLVRDAGGDLWIATNRGISRLDPDGSPLFINYNIETGLTSNSTYFVEFQDRNSLWIGTERGINVLDIATGRVRYLGYEQGFYPLESYSRAVSRGKNGSLWIGTTGGLVRYDPEYDLPNPVPPDLILFPPLVEGKPYSGEIPGSRKRGADPSSPSFSYQKNSLIFNYTAIHTTHPGLNRFSNFLEGFDDDWSSPDQRRSVTYRKLPPGSYIFRVKAYNPDGLPVEQDARFAFTIRPPFWRTYWFILLEVLTGLLLIYLIIKYRERQLIREKRILETRVRERTREIEEQKVEIESQRDKISEQKIYVEQQRDHIALQNKEITDSILYAKRIQQAILPGRRILERTLREHFIMFRPRDIVSGDFYWVEEKNERVIICAADCTGHGVPGAFMSLLGLTFLNEIVNKDGILKAGKILDQLRSSIIRSMSHRYEDAEQARDGMDLSLVVVDRQLGMLEYAGAYNPLLLVRQGELIEYKADKMPIGKHVGEEGPFTNHRIDLQEGDMIYLYSDGFADQFGGKKGSKYKARPFKRLLQRISDEPVKQQHQILEQELTGWMDGGRYEQVDDILVMGIRYRTHT